MLYIHNISMESVLTGGSLDSIFKRWKTSRKNAKKLVSAIKKNGGWKEPEPDSDCVALDWQEESNLIPVDIPGKKWRYIHYHRGDEYTQSQLIII